MGVSKTRGTPKSCFAPVNSLHLTAITPTAALAASASAEMPWNGFARGARRARVFRRTKIQEVRV